jgi:hypothetical protein
VILKFSLAGNVCNNDWTRLLPWLDDVAFVERNLKIAKASYFAKKGVT